MKNARLMSVCWIAGLGLAAPVLAQDMPHRKPGLWETNVSVAQAAQKLVAQQCIDEKTDAEMLKRSMGGKDKDTNCTQRTSNA